MAASQLALLSGRLSHDTARNFFVSLRTPWFGALRSAWCPDRISGSPITLDFPTGNSRRRELRRTCWPGALNIVCSDENADRVQSKQSDSSPMTNAEPVLSDQHPPSSVLVIIPLCAEEASDDATSICTIATSIWDFEEWRGAYDQEGETGVKNSFVSGDSASCENDLPLMLTIGRPFIQSLFNALVEAGRVCRVDPGGAGTPQADRAPLLCRTIREIDDCFDALTSDIDLPAHDDVYPIHIWGLPRDVEDAGNELVDAFWSDPNDLDFYRAALNAGIIVASISTFSCDLSMSYAEFASAQEYVRAAVRLSGLVVEWRKN